MTGQGQVGGRARHSALPRVEGGWAQADGQGSPATQGGAWAFRDLLCGDGSFVGPGAATQSQARPSSDARAAE